MLCVGCGSGLDRPKIDSRDLVRVGSVGGGALSRGLVVSTGVSEVAPSLLVVAFSTGVLEVVPSMLVSLSVGVSVPFAVAEGSASLATSLVDASNAEAARARSTFLTPSRISSAEAP